MKVFQAGIGLIELMISMLIGLFVMAGVVQMFGTTTQNAVANAGASRIQENVRYVFSRITEDIAQSGNLGCFSISTALLYPDFNPVNNMLTTNGSGDAYDYLSTISGSYGGAGDADQDAAGNNPPAGTDTFRIRYVNTRADYEVSAVDASSVSIDGYSPSDNLINQYDIVAVGDCEKVSIFMVTNDTNPVDADGNLPTGFAAGRFEHDTSAASNGVSNSSSDNLLTFTADSQATTGIKSKMRLYAGSTGSYEYAIGTAVGRGVCNPTTSPQNCALYRTSSGERQELVQGVHDIEVQYGWTDDDGNLRFSPNPDAATARPFIDRMRVTMSFNSIDNVVTTGNTIDQTSAGLITRTVTRTFNLYNQL